MKAEGGRQKAEIPPSFSAFCLLLSAFGCASAPQPTVPPSAVPGAVVAVMCAQMRSEGMTAGFRVVKTTQPIVTPAVISAMADVAFYRGKPVAPVLPNALLPVEPAPCARAMIEAVDPRRDADAMILQFSSPFSNPYTRRQIGVVARLSLGEDNPVWYWIPMVDRNGSWAASSPLILGVRE